MNQVNALQGVISSLQMQNGKGTLKNTINEGQIKNLRNGDGMADILGKIYILMKKEYEEDKRLKNTNKNFEAENKYESTLFGNKDKTYSRAGGTSFKKDDAFNWMKALGAAGAIGALLNDPRIKDEVVKIGEHFAKWAAGIGIDMFSNINDLMRNGISKLTDALGLPEISPENIVTPTTGQLKRGISVGAKGLTDISAAGGRGAQSISQSYSEKSTKLKDTEYSRLVKSISPEEERALKARGQAGGLIVDRQAGVVRNSQGAEMPQGYVEKILGRNMSAGAAGAASTASNVSAQFAKVSKRVDDIVAGLKALAAWIDSHPTVKKSLGALKWGLVITQAISQIQDSFALWVSGKMSTQKFNENVAVAVADVLTTLLASEAGAIIGGALGTIGGGILLSFLPGVGTAAGAILGGTAGVAGGLIGGYFGAEAFDKIGGRSLIEKGVRKFMGGEEETPADISGSSAGFVPDDMKSTLNMIGGVEGGAAGYNSIVGGGRTNLTDMTIGQVKDLQKEKLGKKNGYASDAVGRYQFIGSTLDETAKKLGMSDNTKFTPEVQDALAVQKVRDAGWSQLKSGKLTPEEFQNNISKTWAAIPTTEERSYHEGKGGNKALVTGKQFRSTLPKATNVSSASPSQQFAALDTENQKLKNSSSGTTIVAPTVNNITNGSNQTQQPTVLSEATPRNTDSMIERVQFGMTRMA